MQVISYWENIVLTDRWDLIRFIFVVPFRFVPGLNSCPAFELINSLPLVLGKVDSILIQAIFVCIFLVSWLHPFWYCIFWWLRSENVCRVSWYFIWRI